MSFKALAYAFDREVKSPHDKLVLLYLADSCTHEHRCWPSLERIAHKTNLSQSDIIFALDRLEDAGIVHFQIKTDMRGDHYELSLPELIEADK